jgi:hypothetical protein
MQVLRHRHTCITDVGGCAIHHLDRIIENNLRGLMVTYGADVRGREQLQPRYCAVYVESYQLSQLVYLSQPQMMHQKLSFTWQRLGLVSVSRQR